MSQIILGICGGIAAYKSILLARELNKQKHRVQCVLTESARTFVTEETLQAITGLAPRHDLFDANAEAAMSHIELARWADILLIAPATANTIAKLAHGIADDLLTTLYLATDAEIVIAPAMNHMMWHHPATQENIAILSRRPKHHVLPVAYGEQACGESGLGRMLEPEEIIAALPHSTAQDWQNIRLTITAGATREPIDPVRYISNHSSGKMGYELAKNALARGAKVTLISGISNVAPPKQCRLITVNTALEMYDAVHSVLADTDIFIGAAAVADYRVAQPAAEKIKKSVHGLAPLTLIENPDIIASVAAAANRPFTVGFAAETEHLLDYARAKKQRKNLDMIIANDVRQHVFGSDTNSVTMIGAGGEITLPTQSKALIAQQILDYILTCYQKNDCSSL